MHDTLIPHMLSHSQFAYIRAHTQAIDSLTDVIVSCYTLEQTNTHTYALLLLLIHTHSISNT